MPGQIAVGEVQGVAQIPEVGTVDLVQHRHDAETGAMVDGVVEALRGVRCPRRPAGLRHAWTWAATVAERSRVHARNWTNSAPTSRTAASRIRFCAGLSIPSIVPPYGGTSQGGTWPRP